MLDDKELYRRAREQVEARRGFLVHLLTYLVCNLALFFINWQTRGEGGAWWFYWPLFGWGIGLVAHGLAVFGFFGLFGREWEEREVERLVAKEREKQTKG